MSENFMKVCHILILIHTDDTLYDINTAGLQKNISCFNHEWYDTVYKTLINPWKTHGFLLTTLISRWLVYKRVSVATPWDIRYYLHKFHEENIRTIWRKNLNIPLMMWVTWLVYKTVLENDGIIGTVFFYKIFLWFFALKILFGFKSFIIIFSTKFVPISKLMVWLCTLTGFDIYFHNDGQKELFLLE